jgi:NADH dehydrogenase [ubiquinone] 1 alpha subcomplex assembly factor 7
MTPVEKALRQLIALEGPQPVERVMGMANACYYATRQPLGAQGDFMTSPEISQMFGELLGVWVASVWEAMGRPTGVRLAELGPGRGTLMDDLLRASRVVPDFARNITLHLVETSPLLREAQAQLLKDVPIDVSWHAYADEIPDGPLLLVANEFFDALPVHHYVKQADGWHKRVVGLDKDELVFGLSREALPDAFLPPAFHHAGENEWAEYSPDAIRIVTSLASRIAAQGGAALIVDYGHTRTQPGETLQAVHAHEKAALLENLGSSDLSAHVDFQALGEAARGQGVLVPPVITQAELLQGLGLGARAQKLIHSCADDAGRQKIYTAAHRLMDTSTAQSMGSLFKAMCVHHKNIESVPLFKHSPEKLQTF